MDQLTRMFMLQRDMQEKSFGHDFTKMTDEERIEFIRWNVLALISELNEMLDEIGWKPWAKSNHINESTAFGELIDAWHFMMNLALVISPNSSAEETAQAFVSVYEKKRRKNIQRQIDGYDGVSTKCPWCKRALDDAGAIRVKYTDEHGNDWRECTGCGCELDAHFSDEQLEYLMRLAGDVSE